MDAVRKDLISHPEEFLSFEANAFKKDLKYVIPEKELNDITGLLENLSTKNPFDAFVSDCVLNKNV